MVMVVGCREKISRIRESRMREMKRVYEARAENIAKGHGQVRGSPATFAR